MSEWVVGWLAGCLANTFVCSLDFWWVGGWDVPRLGDSFVCSLVSL